MIMLLKRHILCFLRDRWAVFFSFLSVFIILGLFLVFLGNFIEGSVPSALRENPAIDYLVYGWVLSGVLMVSTVTAPLGFLGIMVRDLEKKTVNDFYTAPLSRRAIVFSYLLAAVCVGTLLAFINLVAGQFILYLATGYTIPLLDTVLTLLLVILSTTLFSAVFYFIVSFIKTSNAHGTLGTLVGTLIGFIGGMYVPIGNFGSVLQTILKSLPVMQSMSAIRLIYMRDAMSLVFGGQTEPLENYQAFFGIRLWIFDQPLSLAFLILLLILWLIIFTALSLFRMKNFKRT